MVVIVGLACGSSKPFTYNYCFDIFTETMSIEKKLNCLIYFDQKPMCSAKICKFKLAILKSIAFVFKSGLIIAHSCVFTLYVAFCCVFIFVAKPCI